MTYLDQENNRRNTSFIEDVDGSKISCANFDRKYGRKPGKVHKRRESHWSDAAIVYEVTHPEIGLTTLKSHDRQYRDKDGFLVLVPTITRQQQIYRDSQNKNNKVDK